MKAHHHLIAAFVVATAGGLVVRGIAQTSARPQYEVASLKLDPGCTGGGGFGPSPGRLSVECVHMRNLIRAAYGMFTDDGALRPRQIQVIGGPAWLDADNYQVHARAADGAPVNQTAGTMLQALLEDRCKLKIHKESREVPIYVLTVTKGGAKLHASTSSSCAAIDLRHPSTDRSEPNPCSLPSVRAGGTTVTADGQSMTIAEFAGRMLSAVGRPVVDRTGITGRFDIHLEFTPPAILDAQQRQNGGAPIVDTSAPSVFTAVQEQLGLKLSPDKGNEDVLVIDSIERPSEN